MKICVNIYFLHNGVLVVAGYSILEIICLSPCLNSSFINTRAGDSDDIIES